MADRYIVAAMHEWNRRVFDEAIRPLPGHWQLCQSNEELESALGQLPAPRYVFFLHWSWKVPSRVTSRFECINFHMTDLPYGRGGSPLQNLIIRGHKTTKMSAVRMVEELDAGPVYMNRDLDLSGTAAEIYDRGSRVAAGMIREICAGHPAPVPQRGEPVVFKRRQPAESCLPDEVDTERLYDFVRMLDAPGYPHAFADVGNLRIEFTGALIEQGTLTAQARFTKREEAN